MASSAGPNINFNSGSINGAVSGNAIVGNATASVTFNAAEKTMQDPLSKITQDPKSATIVSTDAFTPEDQVVGTPSSPPPLQHPGAIYRTTNKVCRHYNGINYQLRWSFNSKQSCNNKRCVFEHVCFQCKSNNHVFQYCPLVTHTFRV